ncbi:MAG: molybdopterin synthase catalytic subunit [Patiriisocius sp.]|jgi:molybdopterin synthase catalytic subunit
MSKSFFHPGPIPADYSSEIILKATKSNCGAHNIFLGQIRADNKINGSVTAIQYSAQTQLAEQEYDNIIQELHGKFDVENVHVRHSIGTVKTSEICLFIFISSPHRSACQLAMDWLIEAVKKRVPIFAKEMVSENEYSWKVNTEKQTS